MRVIWNKIPLVTTMIPFEQKVEAFMLSLYFIHLNWFYYWLIIIIHYVHKQSF